MFFAVIHDEIQTGGVYMLLVFYVDFLEYLFLILVQTLK